jgi:hypothetical protein
VEFETDRERTSLQRKQTTMMKGGKVAATLVLLFLAFAMFVCSLVMSLWNLQAQFEDDCHGRPGPLEIKIVLDFRSRGQYFHFRLLKSVGEFVWCRLASYLTF